MKCGSVGCDRPAVARWVIVAHPLTVLQGTALLCLGHDEWYQDHDAEIQGGAFRIGPLANEVCLHSPSQREAARGDEKCTCPPVKWQIPADSPRTHMLRCPQWLRSPQLRSRST